MYVLLINCHCPDSGCRLKESLATLWRRTFLAFERYYPGSIPAELICFSPNAQCPVGDYLTKCFDSLPDAVRSRLCLLIDDYDAGVRAIERQSDNAEEKRAEWAAMLEVIRNTTATGALRRVFITTGTPNGREELDFAKDISQDPVFSDIMGFTERELRDLIQRTIDLKRCRSTEEALCRQLSETYKKFDFNSITNKSVLPPNVCLFYLNAWQRTQQPPQVPFESMHRIDSHYVIETKLKSSFVLGPIIELTQNCPTLR